MAKRVNELKGACGVCLCVYSCVLMCVVYSSLGVKESDTGLSPPSQWDLVSDKQMMHQEQPLQVARCTKIINANTDEAKYVINIRQMAKYVVGLGERVAPTDIEEGMRVG